MDRCAYNNNTPGIDNLYNTGRIDPPGMVMLYSLYSIHALIIHTSTLEIKFFISNIIALSMNNNYVFAKN